MRGQERLQAAAVEGRGLERCDLDLVQAAHNDRNHIIALRVRSARERAYAALCAEQLTDGFFAELVVFEGFRAGTQRDACRWPERPERAALLADRAIAGHDAAEVGRHLEPHLAAMTAAGIGLGSGHIA